MYNRPYGCGSRGWGRHQPFFNTSPVDITESDTSYTIRLYAPGLVKENISVTTQRDILSIKYTAPNDEKKENFTRREYRPENIERTFDLKGKVDADNIRSVYQEGILTIELPKTEAAQKPPKQVNVV